MSYKGTKKQQLAQELELEKAVRLGLCACLINLIVQHAKTMGGDPVQELSRIQTALKNTAASLQVNVQGTPADKAAVSEFIQQNVSKILDQIFRDAHKRMSKPVH